MIRQGKAGYPVREIVIHCSATRPAWMEFATTTAKVAEIRRWHMQDRGWRDIGYHWIIDRDGTVRAGRDEAQIGAHVVGHNTGTLGICLIGGHGGSVDDTFHDHFTDAQEVALRRLIREIKGRTSIERISGHNQYAAKACPSFYVPTWIGGE
ncbi:MAG: N-acetylmuramoyl-L-alanine amidase [Rhodobacteraceae bacterium]|nr:N-acetylmuramoyl-L-alanine amidase [Paracoccaceae bacterium]MCB2132345.1 N-acetylmuramoyl-L-alanine amidase [Paracoccaceae bacterium]MCB2138102.1 N-acetylmuramoyl-L-alanine amidase [Paracoccaceae bacterium]MCB2159932.1 N-acetylmuramoyl-L-alanine amidase [Paracoccaceae bacterium]